MDETLEGGRGPPRAVEPLEREISDSDKLKITLNSVSYPFLTILPTPNYYGMVYLS